MIYSNFKKLFSVLLLLIISLTAYTQVKVQGYTRKNGTYVQPHYRSNPDGNPYNNWSYPGNYNPYTGKIAGGNSSTYLKNYQKVYPNSNTSSKKFENYNVCLTQLNYSGLKQNITYNLVDIDNVKIGCVRYFKDNIFQIYDVDEVCIGIIETRRNGKKFIVKDKFDLKVKTNINRPTFRQIGKLVVLGTIITILGTYLAEELL